MSRYLDITKLYEEIRSNEIDTLKFTDIDFVHEFKKVVRGRWEDCSSGWMCSVCSYTNMKEHNYCPNCGADMRGEV